MYRAVVTGGTGATGHHAVAQMIQNKDLWSEIVLVGRRPFNPSLISSYNLDFAKEVQDGRVKEVIVENLNHETIKSYPDVFKTDASFCFIGTTRHDAGSAEKFIDIDLNLVSSIAKLSFEGGVRHFSHVTAANAGNGLISGKFLYSHTKYLAEEAIKALPFPSATILRPGPLDRGDATRWNEKLFVPFLRPFGVVVHVRDLAKAALIDAERCLSAKEPVGFHTISSSEIIEMTK